MKRLLLMKLLLMFTALACVFTIAACSAKQAAEGGAQESGAAGSSTSSSAWTIDSECSSCHKSEAASTTNSSSLCSIHTSQKLTCATCHSDADGKLTAAHANYTTAKQPTKLNRTTVSSGTCTTCHNADDLKVKTTSVTVLTDSNGTTVNPHDLPANDDHASSITCASCHEVHGTDPVEETAPKPCLSCHHAGVYECGTCHE